jgi:hypothetical protein
VNDYVDFGEAVDNSITTALTIEVWLNYDTPTQHDGILSNDIPFLSKKGFDLGLWDDGRIYWDVGNGIALGRTSYKMPASGWHHVVGTWDGSTVTLYVDGTSVGTASLSGSYADPHQGLWIGKCNNVSYPTDNYPFKGIIDEVRIWNTALTADQLILYDGFNGLLAPYKEPPKAFKVGSSIPLKWQYTDLFGIADSSAANPSVEIKPASNGITSVEGVPIEVNAPGSSGYQYDSETDTWQFNWQTKDWPAGTYNIWIINNWTGQTFGFFPLQLR